ncbi:hypothetical protein [Tenacibaculum sp. 190524A02b]|uniref:hypothetical protein n=1 Tax=Tenacibaculum vairaonense TaxID=3137860 RepID=UPI0031FBA111
MEQVIQFSIYIHAFLGGIGLISGIANVILKKGNTPHKILGKIFFYAMIFSSLISLIIARMPNHENLFLFLIGLFTIYMILSGNRALTLKSKTKLKADAIDKSISGVMFFISIIMTLIGVIGSIQKVDNSILYLFFGGFGIFMTLKDFQTFKTFTKNKNAWIKSHIGRMMGALIAAVTAFIVAGLQIKTVIAWIIPTLIGTLYIVYWNKKFKPITRK